MTTQTALFEGADMGVARPSLTKARELVADVHALAEIMDETFHPACRSVAARAKRLGAHSVARAACWLTSTETLGRHGYDAMHHRAETAAHRWLRRLETERA